VWLLVSVLPARSLGEYADGALPPVQTYPLIAAPLAERGRSGWKSAFFKHLLNAGNEFVCDRVSFDPLKVNCATGSVREKLDRELNALRFLVEECPKTVSVKL
jgi:hypothetical protein